MWPFKKKTKPEPESGPIRNFVIKIIKSLKTFDGWTIKRSTPCYHYIHDKCGLKLIHPFNGCWVMLYVNSERLHIRRAEKKALHKVLRPIRESLKNNRVAHERAKQDKLKQHILECKEL